MWTASIEEVGDRIEACLGWLTPDERSKHERFATEWLRREYLLTRALCRWSLSQYAPVPPADWRFDRTEAGRPFVVGPCAVPSFNLSNAGGLVVCAVAPKTVGVDVEPLRAELPSARAFTEPERDEIRARGPRRAVELWTMKEAYLKACGDGIHLRLERLDLRTPPPGWQIAAFELAPEPWVVAVAVEGTNDLPITFQSAEFGADEGAVRHVAEVQGAVAGRRSRGALP